MKPEIQERLRKAVGTADNRKLCIDAKGKTVALVVLDEER